MAYKPNEFPIFSHIDKNIIDQMITKLTRLLQNISTILSVNPSEIIISEELLIEVIERVEKRRVYFHVFHDGCKMGELNEGALLCFWIVKLHPFHHPKINSKVLNTKIAICLFTNAVYYFSEVKKRDRKISEQFINDLYYSLMYRDISKESLMVLAESFVEGK